MAAPSGVTFEIWTPGRLNAPLPDPALANLSCTYIPGTGDTSVESAASQACVWKKEKKMKTLIVYDSAYGHTEKIARAIAAAIAPADEVAVLRAGEANPSELVWIDLLIVGSPTQGGRPTPAIQDFLSKIPADALKHVRVTAFDTRIEAQEQGIGLRILMRFLGYAAGRIADSLQGKGGVLATPPEGFIVKGKEGPLKQGELERAAGWATGVARAKGTLQVAAS